MRVGFTGISKKKKLVIIAAIVMVVAAVLIVSAADRSADKIEAEDVQVTRVDMSKSVTAAGEVVAANEDIVYFNTGKVFSAMCVEENEHVNEGQRLIKYSNGTYETAQADGFITYINAPLAGSVASTSNYLILAASDKLEVDITVPESEINELAIGDSAEIVVNSNTSKVFSGHIISIKAISTTLLNDKAEFSDGNTNGPMSMGGEGLGPFGSESSTAYYTVSLEFDNDGTLLTGMSATCTVTIAEKKDVMAVPIEAVQFDDEDQAYVMVVSGSDVSQVYVTTGDSDANYVEIKKGLEGDETIRIERKVN